MKFPHTLILHCAKYKSLSLTISEFTILKNQNFWKKQSGNFKKFVWLKIYELLFLWSPILPIEKICMTTFVLCFKIFCDGLFFFNCFFKFFLFLIFQSFNSVGKWIGQIFIFVIRDSFGFQDFSKILFHKIFFLQTLGKKIFRIWFFPWMAFTENYFFRRR